MEDGGTATIITFFKEAQLLQNNLSDPVQAELASAFDGSKLNVSAAKNTIKTLATSTHTTDQSLYKVCVKHVNEKVFDNRRSIKTKNIPDCEEIREAIRTALKMPTSVLHKTKTVPSKASAGKSRQKDGVFDHNKHLRSLLAKMVQATSKRDRSETPS